MSSPGIHVEEEEVGNKNSTFRVLVVDDFKPWLSLVKATLDKEPDMRIVGTALDGPEAIAKAKDLQPDLILMDINLPALNGIEAARQMGRMVPKAKIIFVSVENEPELVRSALAAGALGFLNKLDVERELLPAMKAVANGKQYVSRSCRNLI
jgi:DNA-binding NarL/FixJ family response regulator